MICQQLPLIQPNSDWECPTDFPDLSQAKVIGIDLETRDPRLTTRGPGAMRKDGYIIGVSVYTDYGFNAYYPTRHEGGGNIDEGRVFGWLRDQVKGEQPKVGANFLYDMMWLRCYADIKINGPIWDVQIAEPLLDEESTVGYALGVLCKKYLGKGKNEELLTEAAAAWGVDPKSGMWMMPARHVGPYAEADAADAVTVFMKQKLLLEQQGLWPIFEMESQLTHLLLEMYLKGVRVNEEKGRWLSKDWETQQKEAQAVLDKQSGRMDFDAWSGDEIQEVCNRKGISYPTTDKGNPSFTGPWLKTQGHVPFLQALLVWRQIDRLKEVYVDGLLGHCVNGRVHCQFHPLRKDSEGTRTGRFSSSNPNLQQVPSRDEELAPLIRGLFIPDEGAQWCKLDYSQQEPRVLVHYACKRKFNGADLIKDQYISNPKMDYYKMIAEAAKISRHDAKQVSLALFYGMGIDLLAYNLNRSTDEAKVIYDQYNSYVPFVKELARECSLVASSRGFIKTVLGRHRHFELWELADWEKKDFGALPLSEAQKRWPGKRLRRAFTHKALNALVQGSSADMTKMAMLTMWKERKVVPHLTVHDEIDQSIYSPEEGEYMKRTMENVIKLVVPIYAEKSVGPDWGHTVKGA